MRLRAHAIAICMISEQGLEAADIMSDLSARKILVGSIPTSNSPRRRWAALGVDS
jgi:hypothetical protein